jgi:hypothetical protein
MLKTSMPWKRKLRGGVLGLIGFMLSPLSWWNDLFVNVPLALAFAWLASLIYKPAFEVALVVGYWLTNVAGFVLLHKGAETMLTSEDEHQPSSGRLWKDILVSLAYTAVILILVKLKLIQPLTDYFGKE